MELRSNNSQLKNAWTMAISLDSASVVKNSGAPFFILFYANRPVLIPTN